MASLLKLNCNSRLLSFCSSNNNLRWRTFGASRLNLGLGGFSDKLIAYIYIHTLFTYIYIHCAIYIYVHICIEKNFVPQYVYHPQSQALAVPTQGIPYSMAFAEGLEFRALCVALKGISNVVRF